MPELNFHTYGKTQVRLLQVLRGNPGHEVVEITAKILFEGDLAQSFTDGDNSRVLPTDTIKNTVYVLARREPIETIERFGLEIGRHFLERLLHLSSVFVEITHTPWARIGDHATAFLQTTKERRIARVTVRRDGETVVSGFQNLQILKTGNSAFADFLKDEYTTLPETHDRLMGTILDAEWTLAPGQEIQFDELYGAIRDTLLNVFADHNSRSVQQTLYAMGEAVLAGFDAVREIHMVMPNKHCLLFDLSKFGLDNPNQIFVPTDEPSGFIEARVSR